MSNLLIIILLAVAIAATAGYSAVTLWQGAQDNYAQQMAWTRLEQTAAALKANIKIIDGLPTLPAGNVVNATYAYNQVPSWVTANATGPNGIPLVYCPYAMRNTSVQGTASTVTGPGYGIISYNSSFTGNQAYVVGSAKPSFTGTTALAPKGLLGYLISFKPRDTYDAAAATGWCNNVAVSAAGLLSTDSGLNASGIIYPIVVGQSFYQQAFAKNETVTFYVGAAASGDKTGRNPANYATLDAVMAQLATVKPYKAKIYLTTGTHTVSTVNKTLSVAPAATLTPNATSGTAVILTASSGVFTATDVGKTVAGNSGTAVITAYNSATAVTATTVTAFASTAAIAANSWTLQSDIYDKGNIREVTYDFEGTGSGSTIINVTGNYDLPVNTTFRKLTMTPTGTVIIPAAQFSIAEDAILNKVDIRGELWARGVSQLNTKVYIADGGRLVINGTVASSVPNQGVVIWPGKINILSGKSWTVTATSNTVTVPGGGPRAPVIIHAGGELSISGALTVTSDASTQLKSGINVVPGGYIYMNGNATTKATITFDSGSGSIAGDTTGGNASCNGAICLGGEMAMYYGGLAFPNGTGASVAAVTLVDGGSFYMQGASYIGASGSTTQRPYYGVYDNGGTAVGGSSTGYVNGSVGEGGDPQSDVYAIAAGACWTGNGYPASGTAPTTARHLFTDSDMADTKYSTAKSTASPIDYRHLKIQNQSNWQCHCPGCVVPSSGGGDTTPDDFYFADACTTINATYTTTAITPKNYDTAVPISIACTTCATGTVAEYSLNGGTYTSSAGTISPGTSFSVRVPTSSTAQQYIINVTVGSVVGGAPDGTFRLATRTGRGTCAAFAGRSGGGGTNANKSDLDPDNLNWGMGAGCAYSFYNDCPTANTVTSKSITPIGYDTPTSISVSCEGYSTDCFYSINGGTFTNSPGTISPGDTLRVRHDNLTNHSGSGGYYVDITFNGHYNIYNQYFILPK